MARGYLNTVEAIEDYAMDDPERPVQPFWHALGIDYIALMGFAKINADVYGVELSIVCSILEQGAILGSRRDDDD